MDNLDLEVRKHQFILFCVDHYNPLGVLRSLGEKGIEPYTILWENKESYLVPNSRFLGPLKVVATIEEGYKHLLSQFGEEKEKPFVITCDDKIESYLDDHYNDIIEKFYFFHGSKRGIVNYYMNKDNINSLAVECGFSIPKAEVLNRGELPTTLKYPVITKTIMSIMGAWKADSFICETPDELRKAYEKIEAPQLLVEEYIKKKTEFCYDAFCVNEGKEVCIPFQSYYLRTPHDSYGCYMEQRPFSDKEVESKISSMLQRVGYTGIFEVEFLVGPNDEVYFLEINFRNSTWSHAATFGGINMPYQWAKSVLSGKLDIEGCERRPAFKAMVEPADFMYSVIKEKQVSLWRWIKDVKGCDYFYYWSKDDKIPFFKMLLKNLSPKKFINRL